ncbi:MAG: CBS domain-containing protein [Pseudomonadota bacterium]
MKIKDRPEFKSKEQPFTMLKDQLVSEAIRFMSERNFGSVAIVDKDFKVEGIVTERDFMRRLLDKGLDPKKTKLVDIMSTEIKSAQEDDDIVDWLRMMSNERFRHVPVVDKDGKLLKMMSQGDFVSYTWPSLISTLTEKTKESILGGYQISLIVFALLVYALIIHYFG